MPDQANPLTGYRPSVDTSGKGGRARETTIMNNVDAIAGGGKALGGDSGGPPHPAAVAAKTPKSSFAPSGDNGPHVYGTPISAPILSGGK